MFWILPVVSSLRGSWCDVRDGRAPHGTRRFFGMKRPIPMVQSVRELASLFVRATNAHLESTKRAGASFENGVW